MPKHDPGQRGGCKNQSADVSSVYPPRDSFVFQPLGSGRSGPGINDGILKKSPQHRFVPLHRRYALPKQVPLILIRFPVVDQFSEGPVIPPGQGRVLLEMGDPPGQPDQVEYFDPVQLHRSGRSQPKAFASPDQPVPDRFVETAVLWSASFTVMLIFAAGIVRLVHQRDVKWPGLVYQLKTLLAAHQAGR